MTTKRLGLIMNGVTGRMGLNQHLIRSIIAIRDQGGVLLANGDRMLPDPILIGRDADKVERLAKRFNVERWSTDLDKALADKNDTIFFDAATTQARPSLLTKAINAGKHVYCEKPIATNLEEAVAVLKLANARGVKHGTVQDKLFLPGLKKLGDDFAGKVGLAVSLHAPDDATRERIVPMNKRYPLAELMQALRSYPLPKRRRITIEYTLIDGVNDSDAHADRLVRLLGSLPVKVNLIPMNPVVGSDLKASPAERVDAFQARVAGFGYSCFVRARRGDEVSAACGQLALEPGLIELGRSRAPA